MGSVTLVTTDHHASGYYCSNCEWVYWGHDAPMKGYWFDVTSPCTVLDQDGDPFFEGGPKVIKGRETYCCHNEEYPHFIGEGDWEHVSCQAWRCDECGRDYSFDNDNCSEHTYAVSEDAERDAKQCCSPSGGDKKDLYELEKLSQPRSDRYVSADPQIISPTPPAVTAAAGEIFAITSTGATINLDEAINKYILTRNSSTVTSFTYNISTA